jgi:hypothetical protein
MNKELQSLLLSIASYWHIISFAAGGIWVYQSYLALFGRRIYQSSWGKIIRHADINLWASGFFIIAIGAINKGIGEYILNPKLLAKSTVVLSWFLSTQYLRKIALAKFKNGNRNHMLFAASINISGWIYGGFLGCAHSLANGIVSYKNFLFGFLATIIASAILTKILDKKMRNSF